MNIIYEGTDITNDVNVTKCIHRDVSRGRCDCLEIEMENADVWYRWGPMKDDRISVNHLGYDTGTLYLNTVIPEENQYRILATSAPSAAKRRAYKSFINTTLGAIMTICAGECKMKSQLYGLDKGLNYSYIIRQNESVLAFLDRVTRMEGGVLKCLNGAIIGIGVAYAQGLNATQTIQIDATQVNSRYIRRGDLKKHMITVRGAYGEAGATDSDAEAGIEEVIDLCACDSPQAGRWARGLLLNGNREAEELDIEMEFNAGFTAMARVNANGTTDSAGRWIIDEVMHDFINGTTSAKLLRLIETVR